MKMIPRPYRRRDRKRLALKSEPVLCLHPMETLQWVTLDSFISQKVEVTWHCYFCGAKGAGSWSVGLLGHTFTGDLPVSLQERVKERA